MGDRRPGDVPPAMLETVLALVAAAEEATADVAPTASAEEWESAVGPVLRATHPGLLDEPIRAVADLLRGEAPDRDWRARLMPRLEDVARDLYLHLYDATELALIAEAVPEQGARPHVEAVGGDLFVGVDRRASFLERPPVTEDDVRLWAEQQQVTFAQLLAAGIAQAEPGKHVARDGSCSIHFADLAAAVLLDPALLATVIDERHAVPGRETLVPDGELVALPMTRGLMVMTGSGDEAGLASMLEQAEAESVRHGRHLVTPRPLVLRGGRWQAFEWAAGLPHLADRIRALEAVYDEGWLGEVSRQTRAQS